MDNFIKALDFVELAEGGYSEDEEDKGNWTGGAKGVGVLKGTKYGISAASFPELDIKNLTKHEARAIYKRDYWDTIDGDNLPWPLALVAFDHAVNAGVSRAQEALKEVSNTYEYIARRLYDYTTYDTWEHHGRGWTRRMANLLREVVKEDAKRGSVEEKDVEKRVSDKPEDVGKKKPEDGGSYGNVNTVVFRLPKSVGIRLRDGKIDIDLRNLIESDNILS